MTDPVVLVGTREGLFHGGDGAPAGLSGREVDHLHAAPSGLWAIADGTEVVTDPHTSSGGSVAAATNQRANCLLALDERLYLGASEATLLELANGSLRRLPSFDDAPGRSAWYTPWGGPADVRSMSAGVEGNVYINVHVGGIVRSTDAGNSWTDTVDIHADVHQVVADPERAGTAYAAAAIGLGVTQDGGDSWAFDATGLLASYCRAVAVSDSYVYVSASSGPSGRRAALYRRSRRGNGTLERCAAGLPEWFSTNVNTFCLAARGQFVVAGDEDGTLYVSHDDGDSWSAALTGLPSIRCLEIM